MTLPSDERGALRSASIADNGVGLPAERERITEPYMTTRARGTGLGLAIVKKIVEEHFGAMHFADRPGGGTVVTLASMPARWRPLVDQPTPPTTRPIPAPAMLTRELLDGIDILVVDDE